MDFRLNGEQEEIQKAAREFAKGEPNLANEVAEEAIYLHGGYGCMLEYEVEGFYRNAKKVGSLSGEL